MAQETGKCPDVLSRIRRGAKDGHILFTRHADERCHQRGVDYADVKRVLLKGQREEEKDRYDAKHGGWSYAMKGTTLDEDCLRVVVVLKAPGLLVVTVYLVD